METEYIWEIKPKNTPALKRKCNHCNCDRFYCSNKFRMNAQKRNIDVWLIYRCVECDSTYNLTILSRTKPEQIKKELFRKFSENDEELAWEYAFSSETGRKNSVELDYSSVEYEILHDDISINDILNADDKFVTFKIQTRFEFGLKLSSVIRICLGLSANQLNRLIEAKAIFSPEGYSLKKHKVKDGDVVLVNKHIAGMF
ncbi:DUF1062 domain-containing protein [uncultured Parabacteroides sp.]|uniref:DUF1062 domain-containing protein n=2 Tax=Parabacteroides TaxID=375288 RepID=UPI00259B5C59|nr:DUF1062 domain-containing protein [uncultured Parabacteroides sp.]